MLFLQKEGRWCIGASIFPSTLVSVGHVGESPNRITGWQFLNTIILRTVQLPSTRLAPWMKRCHVREELHKNYLEKSGRGSITCSYLDHPTVFLNIYFLLLAPITSMAIERGALFCPQILVGSWLHQLLHSPPISNPLNKTRLMQRVGLQRRWNPIPFTTEEKAGGTEPRPASVTLSFQRCVSSIVMSCGTAVMPSAYWYLHGNNLSSPTQLGSAQNSRFLMIYEVTDWSHFAFEPGIWDNSVGQMSKLTVSSPRWAATGQQMHPLKCETPNFQAESTAGRTAQKLLK